MEKKITKKINLPSNYTMVSQKELTINGEIGIVALILFGISGVCKIASIVFREKGE